MSVPGPLRKKSPFETQMKVDEMAQHTITIISNEKVFDPKYHVMTDRIMDTVLDISEGVYEANEIKVRNNPKRWERRRDLQERALGKFDRLHTLARISRSLYHLRGKKYSAWVDKICTAETSVDNWAKSDKKRFKHLNT